MPLVMDSNTREKPIITTGTRMVVRRPDGLGTAQVGTSSSRNEIALNSRTEVPLAEEKETVRPHSTIQRAHSTVIPRSKSHKKSEEISPRINSIMQKLISTQRINDKILLNSTENSDTSSKIPEKENSSTGLHNENKNNKKQKQRVGVNPVLGNAGVMWEAGKNVKMEAESELSQLVQKRKSSVTEEIISPKKSKILEEVEKRKDLDSYTGCLPQHMLHLLPATPKSIALSSGDSILQPDLTTLLQQYSTLQAATGLANNENAKTLLGAVDQSTALLQLHFLQSLQKQAKLTDPIVVNPSWSATSTSAESKSNKVSPSPVESPYKITPKIEKTNSKVKCLKTALIPSITKAELDSAPKITAYQGLKMATNVIKPRNNGSITPKKIASNKIQASTCILPRITTPYSVERQTQLNILGESEKLFREFVLASIGKPGGSVSASITLTNDEGDVKCFQGTCQPNSTTSANALKTVIEFVPKSKTKTMSATTATLSSLSSVLPVSPSKIHQTPLMQVPISYSMPVKLESAITPTPPAAPMFTITSSKSKSGCPSITLNTIPIPRPTHMTPLSTLSSSLSSPLSPLKNSEKEKKINLNFPVLDNPINLSTPEKTAKSSHMSSIAKVAATDALEELSPASSPEIVVDELTPDQNEKKVKKPSPESSPITAAAALKQQLSPPTPMRPASNGQHQRGPKKNFLARQAALDAKLNVLRIRAEKSGVKPEDIHIEMSDDEEINK